MNPLWAAVPKLLAAYDRYVLRSFIVYRAGEVVSIIHEDEQANRCGYSNVEVWILAACIGVRAYDQSRKTHKNGAETIWTDLGASLMRRYAKEELADSAKDVKWDTVGDFFRWFGTRVEKRYLEYAQAIDADINRISTSPNFWSGDFNVRVRERVFTDREEPKKNSCDLRAYEISSHLLIQAYPSILDLFSRPSLRRFVLAWYSVIMDSFWMTYRPATKGSSSAAG